jgi:uncharacterized membrane protein
MWCIIELVMQMKKHIVDYSFYLIFYSIGGFFLERIINILFLGTPFDNSFLIGPYQPLYGSGVVLTILFYDLVIARKKYKTGGSYFVLLLAAIFFTGVVEMIAGEFLEYLTGIVYWDYGLFFNCTYPYTCFVPTSIFGLLSMLVVLYVHPYVKNLRSLLPNYVLYILFGLFIADAIYRIASYL